MAQLGHAEPAGAIKAAPFPAQHSAQQSGFVLPLPAYGREQPDQRIERRRQVWQAQASAVGKAQCHGQAVQGLLDGHAHPAHQAKGFGVSPNQDVLAVVQVKRLALTHNAR